MKTKTRRQYEVRDVLTNEAMHSIAQRSGRTVAQEVKIRIERVIACPPADQSPNRVY